MKDGLMGWQCSWAYWFWFGPQNHHRLIWAGRGLDKIDDQKDFGGTWWTSRGCVGLKQPLEAMGAVG